MRVSGEHLNQAPQLAASKLVYRESITLALARTLLAFLVVLFFALIFLPWVQTSQGSGRLITFDPNDREQIIEAPLSGRVSKWYVVEGSKVEQGELIGEMVDIDPRFVERLTSERDAIAKELEAAQLAVTTSRIDMQRQLDLYNKGLSARKDYELAKLKYADLLAKEAKVAASLARIDVRLGRQSSQAIEAPRSGTITRLGVAENSEVVSAGDPLAIIVPSNAKTVVEVMVDGLDGPLISKGRKARLQFEGWPAVQFAGWPGVAIGSFGGVVLNVDPITDEAGKLRVMIQPDPEDEPWPDQIWLRQGVRAKAWIQLDTVSLGYELWRVFNNFPPAINRTDTKQNLSQLRKEKSKLKSKSKGDDSEKDE